MTITLNKDETLDYLNSANIKQEVVKLRAEVVALKMQLAKPVAATPTVVATSSARFSWAPYMNLLRSVATNMKSRQTLTSVMFSLPQAAKDVVTSKQLKAKLRNMGYTVDNKTGKIFK